MCVIYLVPRLHIVHIVYVLYSLQKIITTQSSVLENFIKDNKFIYKHFSSIQFYHNPHTRVSCFFPGTQFGLEDQPWSLSSISISPVFNFILFEYFVFLYVSNSLVKYAWIPNFKFLFLNHLNFFYFFLVEPLTYLY